MNTPYHGFLGQPQTPEQLEEIKVSAYQSGYSDGKATERVLAMEPFDRLNAEIDNWARAYPESVFPEPDLAKANQALQAEGITLDAVSASAIRFAITRFKKIIDEVLSND